MNLQKEKDYLQFRQFGDPKQVIYELLLWKIGKTQNLCFNTGFSEKRNMLLRPNYNLKGNLLRVVMPGIHPVFANVHHYPNGSKIRAGFNFHALQYISKAQHFEFE